MGRSPAVIYTLEPFPVYSLLPSCVWGSPLRVGVSFCCMRLIDPISSCQFNGDFQPSQLFLCASFIRRKFACAAGPTYVINLVASREHQTPSFHQPDLCRQYPVHPTSNILSHTYPITSSCVTAPSDKETHHLCSSPQIASSAPNPQQPKSCPRGRARTLAQANPLLPLEVEAERVRPLLGRGVLQVPVPVLVRGGEGQGGPGGCSSGNENASRSSRMMMRMKRKEGRR